MEQGGSGVAAVRFALAAVEGVVGVGSGADLGQAAVAVVGQHTETGDVAGVAGEVSPVGVGAGIGQGIGRQPIAIVRGRAGAGFGLAVAVWGWCWDGALILVVMERQNKRLGLFCIQASRGLRQYKNTHPCNRAFYH